MDIYTTLQFEKKAIEKAKSDAGYSNGITIVKGLIMQQLSFEDCLMFKIRLREYKAEYISARKTTPMLSGYPVEQLEEIIEKRIYYTTLIEKGKEVDRAIEIQKQIHAQLKLKQELTNSIKNLSYESNRLLKSIQG